MKNIVIYGASITGRKIKKIIELKNMYNVLYFCDSDGEKHNKIIDKTKVISPLETAELYKNKDLDFVLIGTGDKYYGDVAKTLYDLGVDDICIIPHYFANKPLEEIQENNMIFKIDPKKPRLFSYQYAVNDHCNLNCKGCGHFCHLDKKESFADFDSYVKDITRLKELFWGVYHLFLMGGEPLLNKDLYRYIEVTRRIFPDAKIYICTNGLLIPNITNEQFKIIRETESILRISNYPPTEKMLESIKIHLDIFKVNYEIIEREMFRKQLTLIPNNEKNAVFENCFAKDCIYLRDGALANCPLIQLVYKFNSYYDKNIIMNDIINIYDDIDAWDVLDRLMSPVESCRYCSTSYQEFDWDVSKKDISELLVEE